MSRRGPNTVNTSVTCPQCDRCISAQSAELVTDSDCLFCRTDEEEEDE